MNEWDREPLKSQAILLQAPVMDLLTSNGLTQSSDWLWALGWGSSSKGTSHIQEGTELSAWEWGLAGSFFWNRGTGKSHCLFTGQCADTGRWHIWVSINLANAFYSPCPDNSEILPYPTYRPNLPAGKPSYFQWLFYTNSLPWFMVHTFLKSLKVSQNPNK